MDARQGLRLYAIAPYFPENAIWGGGGARAVVYCL